MKLHIPFKLRKALLACLAALGSFSTTFMSVSGAFAGVAWVSFVAGAQVVGAASSSFDVPVDWVRAGEFAGPDDGLFTDDAVFVLDELMGEYGRSSLVICGLAGYTYTLSGGDAELDVMFVKSRADACSVITGSLVAHHVFFTGDSSSQSGNLFRIESSGVLSGVVGTVYVAQAGLLIQAEQNMQAGFSIGAAVRTGAEDSVSVLQVAANVTTSGVLEVQQDTGIDVVGATLSVDESASIKLNLRRALENDFSRPLF